MHHFSSKANLHEALTCNHDAIDRVFPIFLRFEGGEISSLVIARSGTPKNVHLFVIHQRRVRQGEKKNGHMHIISPLRRAANASVNERKRHHLVKLRVMQ